MSRAAITEANSEGRESSFTTYMANELAMLQSSPAQTMREVVEVPAELMAQIYWLLLGRRGYMEYAMEPLPHRSHGRGAPLAQYAELCTEVLSVSERVWELMDANCPGWRASDSGEIAANGDALDITTSR